MVQKIHDQNQNYLRIFRYGYFGTFILYVIRVASLLVLPQCIFNMLGLVLFNGFREKVRLKAAPLLAPLVCFRVVTRGDYPELVKVFFERITVIRYIYIDILIVLISYNVVCLISNSAITNEY